MARCSGGAPLELPPAHAAAPAPPTQRLARPLHLCLAGALSALLVLATVVGLPDLRAAAAPKGRAPVQQPEPSPRRLEVCQDSARWDQLPWAYLSWGEMQAWTSLGWTQNSWNAAHPTMTTTSARRLQQATTSHPVRLRQAPSAHPSAEAIVAASDAGAPPATSAPARGLQALIPSTSTVTTTTTVTTYIPPTDSLCYQDLTEVQRDAVVTLGYTIGSWHACKNPSCQWPQGVPQPTDSCLDHMTYMERQLNYTTPWVDLTPAKRDALVLLGWDPVGIRWSMADKPQTYAKTWAELAPRQAEAAAFLGYQPRVWNGCTGTDGTPCIARRELLEAKLSGWRWDTMPTSIRARLQELGWESQLWLDGQEPASYSVAWADLSPSQRVAARLVGYSEDTWMRCPQAQCLDRFRYVQRKYGGISWAFMKSAQQRAWELLEHSEQLWDQGGMTQTRTMQVRWDELTPEQQMQAAFLGHSTGTWQGCNTAWAAPINNASNATPAVSPLRTVRARMVITRPFSEISGNIYGAAVAQLQVSFIQMFERSIGRALFCGNPPLSSPSRLYTDYDGNPLCSVPSRFEQQKHRVKVVSVVEGSIVVEFIISANQTKTDHTAPELFEALQRQLENVGSPVMMDVEFGKFARAASLTEVPLSHLTQKERQEALNFERLRGKYSEHNACTLLTDARTGVVKCPHAGAPPRRAASAGAALLAAMLSVASIGP